MLHKLSEIIADYFFDEKDQYTIDIYVYGIELALSSLFGNILVILIGIVTGSLIESIIFMAALTSVRVFSGGYHANTFLKCNIITLVSAVFTVTLTKLLKMVFSTQIILCLLICNFVLLLFTIIIFCPIENKNKQIEKDDKNKFKSISVAVVIIQAIVCFTFFKIFGFDQVLIIIPTMSVVNISILAEIILKRRREKFEKEVTCPDK